MSEILFVFVGLGYSGATSVIAMASPLAVDGLLIVLAGPNLFGVRGAAVLRRVSRSLRDGLPPSPALLHPRSEKVHLRS